MGPKPSLWVYNKQVTFPVQCFTCLKCHDFLWVFSLEDPIFLMVHHPPWLLYSHRVVSSLILFHRTDIPLKGEGLKCNILVLMIKIHLLRKCILINVIVIKLRLEQIDYHETDVYQLQELKHQSKSLKTCSIRDMESEICSFRFSACTL